MFSHILLCSARSWNVQASKLVYWTTWISYIISCIRMPVDTSLVMLLEIYFTRYLQVSMQVSVPLGLTAHSGWNIRTWCLFAQYFLYSSLADPSRNYSWLGVVVIWYFSPRPLSRILSQLTEECDLTTDLLGDDTRFDLGDTRLALGDTRFAWGRYSFCLRSVMRVCLECHVTWVD